jgi:hypothetical protein
VSEKGEIVTRNWRGIGNLEGEAIEVEEDDEQEF